MIVYPPTDVSDLKQYAVWLVVTVIVMCGFHYGKGLIAFVLDKLYQFFILNNPTQL